MRCTIPGRFIKLFGRSIHCLAKIGDELFFEALQDGLALRTVNSSRSAYASFVFSQQFFFDYNQEVDTIEDSNPEGLLKCKLTMKSCLTIFKSLANIDKTVEQCKIEFKPSCCRLVFVLYCKHGIVKTHNLTFQECERLEAVYQKELCPNLILAQSKVLQETVINFPSSCDEITLTVSPESVKITNYTSDEPDPSKVVFTEMSLVPEEFDNYQIGIDTQVTFCLKELRAILTFSEFVNQPLSIHFEHAGKPIVFSLDGEDFYECNFVMATLSETNETETQRTQNQSIQLSNTINKEKKKNIKKQTKDDKRIPTSSQQFQISSNNISRKKVISEGKQNSPEQTVPKTNNILTNQTNVMTNSDEEFFSQSFPYKEMIVEKPIPSNEKDKMCSQRGHLNSSLLRPSAQATNTSIDLTGIDEEDVLLSTPPVAKKFRRAKFFGNDNEEKKDETKINDQQIVLLAADTDDEDDD